MLRKINFRQGSPDLHLKEFCGAWMEHPFWRTAFILTDGNDMDAALDSSIKELQIDCRKGPDLAEAEATVLQAESERGLLRYQVRHPMRYLTSHLCLQVLNLHRLPRYACKPMMQCSRCLKKLAWATQRALEGARQLVQEIAESVARNPAALISLARLKTADDDTFMHSVAACVMMVAADKPLVFDETQNRLAGHRHRLGKAFMPVAVLNKPGQLTNAEFFIIKTHPMEGHSLPMGGANLDLMATEVCRHHHEKTGGSGCPQGLKGDEGSLSAEMGAACEANDAIASNRPYQSGLDTAESIRKMAKWANRRLDQKVFQAFAKSVGIFPVDALVRLTSGRSGIVLAQAG